MSAGTLTLTNNSAEVSGDGTTFNTETAVGDFIVVTVGGVPYTLPIKSVESATALTLVSVYTGPTQSGSAWSAVPRVALNMVTAALVAQSAEALRGLNYDKQNWQQVFSQLGDIIVKLPDQTEFRGPSWLKITELLKGIDTDRLEEIAQQVDHDAQQVAADRMDVDTKTSQAAIDAQSAAQSKTEAVSANESAQQAKIATDENAASAKADADRAQSANPDNQLKKAANLSDISSPSQALANISGVSKTEIASFIYGLDLTINQASSLSISPGIARLPDGTQLNLTVDLSVNYPTTTASTWYHVYLYKNTSGNVSAEIVTDVPVVSSYPARQKAGDATRRYIGSFRTSSANVVQQCKCINGVCKFTFDYGGNMRVLSGGLSSSDVAISVASGAPITATSILLQAFNASPTMAVFIYSQANGGAFTVRSDAVYELPILDYPNIHYKYSGSASGAGLFVDIGGYSYGR